VRLQVIGDRTEMRLFADANGNGVRQSDIDHGIDLPLTPAEWLDDQARDVSLRINQDITDVAGASDLAPATTLAHRPHVDPGVQSTWAAPPAARSTSRRIGVRKWRFEYSEQPAVSAC
jgi:hypothetical protein